MKVLVVGSTQTVTESKREGFIQACRELGAALAQMDIQIVVGSDNPATADPHVLDGADTIEGRHKVWILRPKSSETPFGGRNFKHLEFSYKRLHGPWSAGRVPQILAADAVLLGKDTELTGYTAPALQRPVLAVASFGGAAAELWPHLQPYYEHLGELSKDVGKLRERWVSGNAEIAVRIISELVRRRVFKPLPRLPLGIYLTLMFACLVLWVVLFANPLTIKPYSFFAMLAVAGLLGTMLRNNLRLVSDPTANFSWNELVIELGAGLILGFALALLYLVSALTITGSAEVFLFPKDDGYQRVAVVMTLLGLGGGLMIEQAANRVRRWFEETFQAPS